MMSTFRTPDFLERLGRHPMKGALAKCLDVAETFIGDCERVRIDRHLSDSGRVAAVEKHLRGALRDIRDARAPISEMRATVQATRGGEATDFSSRRRCGLPQTSGNARGSACLACCRAHGEPDGDWCEQ